MTRLRSLLFAPADSERKMTRADAAGADAVIFDLEDSVAAERKAPARDTLRAFLDTRAGSSPSKVIVRINPLGSEYALDDLRAASHPAVAAVMLPKSEGRADIQRCAAMLDLAESAAGLPTGGIGILPVATETAQAVLKLPELAGPMPRLLGLTWGGEDLATVIGASANRRADGAWDDCFRLARALTLLSASACGVPAIDTLYADYRDPDGLAAACREARRSGFSGKIAIHPDQVGIINDMMTPDAGEIEQARLVIGAFAANPGAGAVGVGGKMLDRPHLLQAQRILALAGEEVFHES
ncbi:MAG: CoA ester lyase [Novosphingobium sp.]|uniref:HpcH/HpaI aldolase/citrate lyase family protein n=1 Tax=Thauera propionica TaxID=2019431 RepID=UPI0023F285DC|nr:CoA ester lyase [Thauera propionica]MDD3674771.1 CoA ester lyase [Thauera propionica]